MRRAAKWRRLKMHVRFNCFAYKQMLLCLPKLLFILLLPLTCLILPCYVYFIVCLYIYFYTSASSKKGERTSFFHHPIWTMIFIIESCNRSKWQIFVFRFDFKCILRFFWKIKSIFQLRDCLCTPIYIINIYL